MFCLIIGMFLVLASGTGREYHVAIVGFLATGFILTSSSANNFIYAPDILREIAAAGFILLSVLNVKPDDNALGALLTAN
jgi:SHO1 osmosensor